MSILASVHTLAAESGFENPHKWLPEGYEIILGTFAFLVVAFVLGKFGVPAMRKGLAGRTAKIQAELDRSAAARAAGEADVAKVRSDLANADNEAAAIVAAARTTAEQLKRDGLARLEVELVDTRARAIADIESSGGRVASELEGSVARLAVGAAEQIVERSLDHDTQVALVEQFITQLGGIR